MAITSERLNRNSGLLSTAITFRKSLINLEICSRPKLRNARVVNGYSKCGTLEALTIFTCKKMTSAVEQLVRCAVDFTDYC